MGLGMSLKGTPHELDLTDLGKKKSAVECLVIFLSIAVHFFCIKSFSATPLKLNDIPNAVLGGCMFVMCTGSNMM